MSNNNDGSYELMLPPSDGISSLNFCVNSNLLLVTSWDTTVRCYDVSSNVQKWEYSHESSAILDGVIPEKNRVYSSDIHGKIKSYDVTSQTVREIGAHEDGVKALVYNPTTQGLYSGSWDGFLKTWDTRTPSSEVAKYNLSSKIFTMDGLKNGDYHLVVGTADKYVTIYDSRAMEVPLQKRESSIKYQTRCIRTYIDGKGYALASVEGRIAMEYFDTSAESQAKKYAFKCHRVVENGIDTVYPVNSIAFHPVFGTFATGGCDGNVFFWDGANRKRLYHLKRFPTSISSMSFNSDGNLLAVASSYTYEEGEKDHPPDQIFIHNINESKIKPFTK
ncbi:WD40 repeat-containing protein [Tieghemostelium lacteum]|uniref:WD40 repeat-containing protein n=1 Tax=Tieghemostelium lacteum TaxID=361077 RepID=A0A152A7I5_TIELA|nr:WD40 repeat-containing protein [Tieghemostelium lacteum]|eukprot:KYR02164.1 WD40 repeat-containing protein [Tieghemostelium lacteum]